MFKLKYRIIENLEELRKINASHFNAEWENISGFMQVEIGTQKLGGYYHENPLKIGKTGGELINWWLDLFLRCANDISVSKYVAFREPEKYNRWLEFRLSQTKVIFNLALDKSPADNRSFIHERAFNFDYIKIAKFEISHAVFTAEIVNVSKKFIDELNGINPKLMDTLMVRGMLAKLEIIEEIQNVQPNL